MLSTVFSTVSATLFSFRRKSKIDRKKSLAITIDYHTHHVRCGHAQGQIEDYVKAAISRGLTEIGISDHSPLYYLDGNDPIPGQAMAKNELDQYVEEVLSLKARYAGQINVKLGLESDYIESMEAFYADIFAKYPFDYVIGSVHQVFDSHVYDHRRWSAKPDPMSIYAEYYRLVAKSARSGLFDILGHTTAILAYSPRPIPAEIEALQDEALAAIRESDVCVEVNTSGYRKMRTEPFPSPRMIDKAVELGIPLTFSSDSHRPDEVAHAREQTEALFVARGVMSLATFESRQRTPAPLVFQPVLL
jgi:histidinol-phosphatase (PHP family)